MITNWPLIRLIPLACPWKDEPPWPPMPCEVRSLILDLGGRGPVSRED